MLSVLKLGGGLDNGDVFSLQTFWALRYAELYLLAFIQGFIAASVINLLKVNETSGSDAAL